MINPLLKHPILGGLPYDQLKNPTREGIKVFVHKTRRNFSIIGSLFLILAVVQFLLEETIDLFSFLYPVLLLGLALAMFIQKRKVNVSDEEIDRLLNEHSAYAGGKPA